MGRPLHELVCQPIALSVHFSGPAKLGDPVGKEFYRQALQPRTSFSQAYRHKDVYSPANALLIVFSFGVCVGIMNTKKSHFLVHDESFGQVKGEEFEVGVACNPNSVGHRQDAVEDVASK